MWPFKRKEQLETRQAASSFTDAITSAIVAQASGGIAGNPLHLAALEMASGSYARAFAGAEVQASPRVKQAITPSLLALIVRDMIRRGESICCIDTFTGALELLPAGSWNVTGGATRDTWLYQLYLYGPSGSITKVVSADSVVHCQYAYDAATPWLGLSPLNFARTTGLLAANIEEKLSQESQTATGYVLPLPLDSPPKADKTGPYDKIREDLPALRGKLALVETVAAGHGEGRQAAPMQEWQSKRLGMSPPEILAVLRSDTGRAILSACGVPPGLFESNGSSQGVRENYRQFYNGSVMGVSKIITAELSKKLDEEIILNFAESQSHDLATRAGGFKKMIESGMPMEKAMALSGLMSLES